MYLIRMIKKEYKLHILGLIHTYDYLGVNYCVNFSVHAIAKNGYITHYWTFQSTQKLTKSQVWMHPYSTVSPIAQRLVQVHAIVEKIAGVNGP